MTKAKFRFAPEILRRLGEELNPSIDQGILELVKNAYDADASECVVEIDSRGPGRLKVSDDGRGMTEKDILESWLVLGSSGKKTNVQTTRGRTPAGNKGLGRLAALRLGATATLKSTSDQSRKTSTVKLNWAAFDRAKTVDAVAINVVTTDSVAKQGTEITMTGLRREVGRMEVKRVARSLILLADPFASQEGDFRPKLVAPEFQDLEKMVQARYFDDAEYHLVAKLSGGVMSAQVKDWKGEVLFSTIPETVASASATTGTTVTYSAPDAEFELWTFKLQGTEFVSRLATMSEVKEWLSAFGGVHVYLNDLRVAPYGNAGNDWLDMNLARVRSPEERPSTNNSIGRVRVADKDGILAQKTDRSGFVENEAFEELQRFAKDALDWMARRRIAVAEDRRRATRDATKSEASGQREAVSKQIADVKSQPERERLTRAFKSYDNAREREVTSLRKEVQLYRTLSTAGITTATFAHETSGNPIKTIEVATNAIHWYSEKLSAEDPARRQVGRAVEAIQKATRSLGVLAQATLRLVDGDKRRLGRINLNSSIREVLDTYQPFLEGRNVHVELSISEGEAYLQGSRAALESIITNLINNSLSAFERSATMRRVIQIDTAVEDQYWRLSVSDNGPGIVGIDIKDIWLPGESRRPGGTGLGLTIVRDAVADLSGAVSVLAQGPLGGATFTVRFKMLHVEGS